MILQQIKRLKKVVASFLVLVLAGAITAMHQPTASAFSLDAPKIIMPAQGKIVKGFTTGHYGIEITNNYGSPVLAASSGKVIQSLSSCPKFSPACGGGYGNYIIIDHGNGLNTLYSHLSQTAVKVGDKIQQGQIIGKIGRTGKVKTDTLTNLYFEIRLNGLKQNPLNYI